MTDLTVFEAVEGALGVSPPFKGTNALTREAGAMIEAQGKSLSKERCLAERLNLIEAILFEILRQATPAEAVQFLAERLVASIPGADAAGIAARLNRPGAVLRPAG